MFNVNQPAATNADEAAASQQPQRAMAITPLEMRQTSFASGWRGYSREAVRAFLVDASESYELSLRENERLQASIRQYQDLEGGLKSTLVHAQKVADDVRANATQEAERLVKEAQGRAELMMMAAQNRVEDAQREIDGLKLRRREAEANVESIIASLHATLEFIRDQQRDSRVGPLRPPI
jgi:cell division initiation protein